MPDSYTGPHLTFPMTFCGVSKLVEAFKHKQVGTGRCAFFLAHKAHWWQIHKVDQVRGWKAQYLCMYVCRVTLVCSYLFFSPVAAPCSVCSADSWRDLETFKNSSKHQSCRNLPYQGDYHMRYAKLVLSWKHCTIYYIFLYIFFIALETLNCFSCEMPTNINALFVPS